MEDKESVSTKNHAADQIRAICSEYGLYGSIVYYKPSSIPGSDRNRFYIVAGSAPELQKGTLPSWVYPEDIIRRCERNNKLFYPKIWAFDLSENRNQMKATEELVEYLKKAEFIHTIYAEYGLPAPEKIRFSEVNQLIRAEESINNSKLPDRVRNKCQKDLDWFFRRERSRGLRRKWLDYFRSESFPDDKGLFSRLIGYLQRNNQITSKDLLIEVSENIHKLEMQEHEFKLFSKFISEVYPEVRYAAGDKDIVNHGGVGNSPDTQEALGRRVTGEEYAVIRKEHFADEGWSALEDLKQSYWEFRDVYYKACDEPLIAAAYNSITLQYAKCDPLSEIIEPVQMADIPATDFMNFVSLAKANKLRFYIDNAGDFAKPSLENIHVIYGQHQSEKMQGILNRMVKDKVEYSHVLECRERPALSDVIHEMGLLHSSQKPDHIIKPSRGRN